MSLPRTVGYTIPLGFDETFSALARPPSVPQSLRRVEPFKNARGSSPSSPSPSIDRSVARSRPLRTAVGAFASFSGARPSRQKKNARPLLLGKRTDRLETKKNARMTTRVRDVHHT
jgi:hypothetical protein